MADARARDDARDVAALVRALVERTLANATPTNATPTHAMPTDDREATRRADAGRRVATRVLASTLGEGTRARDAMDDGEAVARAIVRRVRERRGEDAAARAAEACERARRRDASGSTRRAGVLRTLLAISEDAEGAWGAGGGWARAREGCGGWIWTRRRRR
jgi:hypothetical protein